MAVAVIFDLRQLRDFQGLSALTNNSVRLYSPCLRNQLGEYYYRFYGIFPLSQELIPNYQLKWL